jgi:uncharacterized protein (DUF2147 family)
MNLTHSVCETHQQHYKLVNNKLNTEGIHMKVLKLAFLLMLMATTNLRAQTNQSSIVGTWESDEKDVRMEYFQDGDHYSARLLWGNKIVEADGTTSKKDQKNPDPSLRSRNIIGIVSLTGLDWTGKDYEGGKIYDPPSGKTYNCKAWVENDRLYLRGFMGVSLMGRTVVWHRYSANSTYSAAAPAASADRK